MSLPHILRPKISIRKFDGTGAAFFEHDAFSPPSSGARVIECDVEDREMSASPFQIKIEDSGDGDYMRDFPLFYALIKGFVFGGVVAFVACYAGLHSRGSSAGVGRSVCLAVIWMIAAIVVFDTALVPLLKVVRI